MTLDTDATHVERDSSGLRVVPDSLHLRDAAVLPVGATCKSGMGFVELKGSRADVGVSESVCDDAFMIAVQLKSCPDFHLFVDERAHCHKGFVTGSVAIYDLRANLVYDLRAPRSPIASESFHALDFYLPRRSLDFLTDDMGCPRIDELRHQPAGVIEDQVVGNLLRSIQPTLSARVNERNGLFVDHVAMALATHVAHAYGGVRATPSSTFGNLAAWQERAAKDYLAANLGGNVALSDLATICELSVRHFTRAFRASTGMSAHAWLRQARVEKAKSLLITKNSVLADIAFQCGFADQSHFTRVFQRNVGLGPGAWRRLYRR